MIQSNLIQSNPIQSNPQSEIKLGETIQSNISHQLSLLLKVCQCADAAVGLEAEGGVLLVLVAKAELDDCESE